MRKIGFAAFAKKRFPLIHWLINYTWEDFLGDLLAGLTVGLTLIPQAIAYSSLAGLGPQYGLYSSFAGSFVYIVFGTIKEVNIGPTAIVSLLTYSYARGIPEQSILLCFLAGCVTVVLGILQLSFLVNFISGPVVAGFTSAASLIIACSQLKGLLGLSFQAERFFEIWVELVHNVPKTKYPDLILSCCCIVVLLSLRRVKDIKPSSIGLRRFCWILGTARNAIVVVITTIISSFLTDYFVLTGKIGTGLPEIKPPPFSYSLSNYSSRNDTFYFVEMVQRLESGIAVVPIISIIGNIAIAKAFSQGRTLDATQELLALGLSNIVGSFFQSMPVAGSFSRSAVSNASGIRTPIGGLYTGILVILSLTFLTPYFYYIPKATLSSVIICAVIFMVEISTLKLIWKCNKRDLIPALVTFVACLYFGVEIGILAGIGIDFAFIAFFNARPKVSIKDKQTSSLNYTVVTLSSGLMYPAVDRLRSKISKHLMRNRVSDLESVPRCLVLDCQSVDKIDFTAIQNIHSIIADLKKLNFQVTLMNIDPKISAKIQSLSSIPTIDSELELNSDFLRKKSGDELSTSL